MRCWLPVSIAAGLYRHGVASNRFTLFQKLQWLRRGGRDSRGRTHADALCRRGGARLDQGAVARMRRLPTRNDVRPRTRAGCVSVASWSALPLGTGNRPVTLRCSCACTSSRVSSGPNSMRVGSRRSMVSVA